MAPMMAKLAYAAAAAQQSARSPLVSIRTLHCTLHVLFGVHVCTVRTVELNFPPKKEPAALFFYDVVAGGQTRSEQMMGSGARRSEDT